MSPTENPAPPVRVLAVAGVLIAVAAWFLFRSYTSPGVRQCLALYHGARTATDTARVDETVTPGSHAAADPRSCGSYRSAGRWH